MRVAQRLAGYSLEEADNLRKATGKKIRDAHRQGAVEVRRGLRRAGPRPRVRRADLRHHRAVRRLLVQQVALGRLRLVAYQTAYLKANYPVEYLAALLTSVKTNKDQTAVFLNECRQLGIPVLVPDVNESESDFSVRAGPTTARTPGRSASACRRCATSARASSRQIVAARDGRRPVHRLLRLLRPRRPAGAEQAHDRVADQGGRRSTRSATRARVC